MTHPVACDDPDIDRVRELRRLLAPLIEADAMKPDTEAVRLRKELYCVAGELLEIRSLNEARRTAWAAWDADLEHGYDLGNDRVLN